MKVLLVDDNLPRCNEIEYLLLHEGGLNKSDIYTCHNTQSAKDLMRNISFDLLILDVVLPKRKEVPNAKYGLNLLSEIKKRPAILKPDKIIGITAHVDDIALFRDQFEQYCELVIEASNRNSRWKKNILDALKFETVKKISKFTNEYKITCLSVHGIETRGHWQEQLKRVVESKVSTVRFESYKYGYFSILSFLIPFLRNIEVYQFKKN